MRFTKSLFIAILLLNLSQPLKAEEESKPAKRPFHENPVLMVLLMEGLLGVNALMASNDPHAYGAFTALVFPLAAFDNNLSNTTQFVMLGAGEAMAFHNIGIDEDEETKGEIFRDNMKAWHGFFVVGLTTAYLMGDLEKKDKTTSFSFMPLKEGGHFMLSYKF
jgi:hypothetical protein